MRRRSKLYKMKKKLIKNIKLKTLDEESKNMLSSLGFSVKFDRDFNLYLWDNINDKRMYTNVIKNANISYRKAENEHFLLEFLTINTHIKNISLYKKENDYKLIYKKQGNK